MQEWFSLLGRETALGAAEVAALSPQATLTITASILRGTGVIPDWDRCGSIVRAGKVLGSGPIQSAKDLATTIVELIPAKDSKFVLGLSAPGMASPRYSNLCKAIKQAAVLTDRKVRIIRSQTGTVLNTGELSHNGVMRKGAEFMIWEEKGHTFIGQVSWEQDVAAYAARDQARPARDARVGMLPPKLAQTLINLAQVPADQTIYDPFCGTGVVLQESLRMGYTVSGSDLSADMQKATKQNLAWYIEQYQLPEQDYSIKQADARHLSSKSGITAIVAEGYLGDAGLLEASPERMRTEANKISTFYREVFTSWKQLPDLTHIVLALPVWYAGSTQITLPILDSLEEIGYSMEQFAPNGDTRLVYHRPGQTVGRMIVKLKKI